MEEDITEDIVAVDNKNIEVVFNNNLQSIKNLMLGKHHLESDSEVEEAQEDICMDTSSEVPSVSILHADRTAQSAPQVPKKKINVPNRTKKEKVIYRYGNYEQYYGYRNFKTPGDKRLELFKKRKEFFENKEILDIGCNNGYITINIAKEFDVKSITGIDIDERLVNRGKNSIRRSQMAAKDQDTNKFPFNVHFVHGNYILKDEVLLEMEENFFDTILCLSLTKWIHLNFGDAGLKFMFKRIFNQLRSGGVLILEPQSYDSYKRRKKLTPDIYENFIAIQFFPKDFMAYLLGPEIGFSEVIELETLDYKSKGFKRPIYVYRKA